MGLMGTQSDPLTSSMNLRLSEEDRHGLELLRQRLGLHSIAEAARHALRTTIRRGQAAGPLRTSPQTRGGGA